MILRDFPDSQAEHVDLWPQFPLPKEARNALFPFRPQNDLPSVLPAGFQRNLPAVLNGQTFKVAKAISEIVFVLFFPRHRHVFGGGSSTRFPAALFFRARETADSVLQKLPRPLGPPPPLVPTIAWEHKQRVNVRRKT